MTRHPSQILCLVTVMLLAACQSSGTTEAPLGERVATIAAPAGTTASTGVVSWEIYRDAEQTTVVGVAAGGTVKFQEQSREGIVDGKRVVTVRITQPALRVIQVGETGDHIDLVTSSDPRIDDLAQRFTTDVQGYSAESEEYGPCFSCASTAASCAASSVGCAACSISNVPACSSCAIVTPVCSSAGYYCNCCFGGATSC
jgi:hypothetical protein